jgi:hypothetical protein
MGQILRVCSFCRLEWLIHSPARCGLGVQTAFSDDTLADFTERLDYFAATSSIPTLDTAPRRL